jgi:hypothetical protein
MNNRETRLYETFLRTQEFGTAQTASIAGNAFAVEQFARLRQTLAQLDAQATAQSSSKRSVVESGTSKKAAREKLRAKLNAITRTAKPLEKTTPGIAGKFRAPARLKDQDLLAFARGVAIDAAPLKDEFIKRGLRADFIEDLSAASAEFEHAISRRIQNTESRVASTATVKTRLRECLDILRELDPVIRNIFADDPAALAAWESASHTERASRRAKSNPQPAQPPPTPAQ